MIYKDTNKYILSFFFISVFTKGPPVPPSKAQAAIVESAKDEDYLSSLRRLFHNKGFILLMVTYGKSYQEMLLFDLNYLPQYRFSIPQIKFKKCTSLFVQPMCND